MVWFALASYRGVSGVRAALVLEERMYDIEIAARAVHGNSIPAWAVSSVAEMVAVWPHIADELDVFADAAAAAVTNGRLRPLTIGPDDIEPPLRPGRVFCAASNFIEHANEMGTVLAAKAESRPYMFMKPSSSVIGQNDVVRLPPRSSQVDWEIELGDVIGQRARHLSKERAFECVAGYTVVNDVSARDLNMRNDFPFKFDWFQGKCFDSFAPIGPWIVPASKIPNPQNLHMKLSVDGEVMQDDTTEKMIFNISEQIEYLSSILTLEPGDVIATGTPTGVGMGRGIYLKAGSVMEASIEKIGTLRNPVAAE